MPGLHHDTLGKDILLLKEHIQRHLYLVQRPLSLMIGGEDRNEHIGVMPDLVQVEVVFVVGMGTLVGVQVVLDVYKRQLSYKAVMPLLLSFFLLMLNSFLQFLSTPYAHKISHPCTASGVS